MRAAVEEPVLHRGAKGTALISKDEKYRYLLTRPLPWEGPGVCWIMLNPSRADHNVDDLTVTKCVGFSARLKASSVTVVNLFGFRATDPKALLVEEDPVGPVNGITVHGALRDAGRVIVAWGSIPKGIRMRAQPVLALLGLHRGAVECLGRTKDGAPKHPSRLGYAVKMERWNT